MSESSSATSPLAGQPADRVALVDIGELTRAYYDEHPDPSQARESIAFGTSGHRGSSLNRSFNESHILAITRAICELREERGIDGPLFLGMDTHALSAPALDTALEVLAANRVEVMIAGADRYTPTPALSRAILAHNHRRRTGLADGIVITPSHNPPEDGGFKYNPPHGGPAEPVITRWIETRANELLKSDLGDIQRMPAQRARRAPTTREYDFLDAYVAELDQVLDMDAIRQSGLRLAVDPLGGAGVHYWGAVAERYGIDLTVVDERVDATFGFMTLDWDGRIRMDPSSPFVMEPLLRLRDDYDVAFACDADHDRHGIVTGSSGLLPPNHYLAVAVDYLFRHRPDWGAAARVGKTAVSTALIDRIADGLGRELYETPVGFKWFVHGLLDGSLGIGVEESAGASFLKRDGSVWTTDKDGIVAALLAAEITARTGADPGVAYGALTDTYGAPAFRRVDAPATAVQKAVLGRLSPEAVAPVELAGEAVRSVSSNAAGNGEPLGGLKVTAESAWFAARPSGTEAVYKIYAESFRGEGHLQQVLEAARAIVGQALQSG